MFKVFKVFGISYSQSQIGSYVLILSQLDNDNLKIPIIIRQHEAAFFASKIENVNIIRPSIWDLSFDIISTLNGEFEKMEIHTIAEGIFYSDLIFNSGYESVRIPCSISDGVAFCILSNSPIYISDSVIREAGMLVDNEGIVIEEKNSTDTQPQLENLQLMLKRAVEDEEYELASKLRDKIKEIKNNQ